MAVKSADIDDGVCEIFQKVAANAGLWQHVSIPELWVAPYMTHRKISGVREEDGPAALDPLVE